MKTKVKFGLVSLTLLISTMIAPLENAFAAAAITAPASGSSNSGALTLSVSGLPTVASGTFNIKLTKVSDSSIYRTVRIKDSAISSGSFSASIDPLLPNWQFLSTNTSAQNVFSYGMNGATIRRFPDGAYNIEFSYQDAAALGTTITLTQTNVTFTTTGVICGAGTYSVSGLTPCTSASAGNFVWESGMSAQFQCDPGTYQVLTGQAGCDPAPLGRFVSDMGATSSTICPAGYTALNTGQISCDPAPAGYASAAGTGNVPASACAPGSYQPDSGQAACLPTTAGHYVDSAHATSQTDCAPGTFQPDTNQVSCLDAEPGKYVSGSAASAQVPCAAGTYAPNAATVNCLTSPANYYVASTGQTSATACPAGYTSPAGSISAAACVAPAATTTPFTEVAPVVVKTCSAKKGKLVKKACLLDVTSMSIPKRGTMTLSVAKAHKKICRVSGTSVKGLKVGQCQVTVKVKPRKGPATVKTTVLTFN